MLPVFKVNDSNLIKQKTTTKILPLTVSPPGQGLCLSHPVPFHPVKASGSKEGLLTENHPPMDRNSVSELTNMTWNAVASCKRASGL